VLKQLNLLLMSVMSTFVSQSVTRKCNNGCMYAVWCIWHCSWCFL